MKLIGNRIIIREIEQPKKSAIVLVEEKEPPFLIGKVEVVGDGVKANKYGSIVLVNRQMAGFVEWNGEMLRMIQEEDVIACE